MNIENMMAFIIGLSLGITIVLIRNILKHRAARTEEISLREILDQLPAHIYWKDKNGIGIDCNAANWKDFGLTQLSDYIGKSNHEIFPKTEADPLEQIDQEVIRTGQPCLIEEGDETELYLSHKTPLRNRKNEIIGVLGASINITNFKSTYAKN